MCSKIAWTVTASVLVLVTAAACASGSSQNGPAAGPSVTPTPRGVRSIKPVTGMPEGTDGRPWWNDTVFYEVFVRSYADSNGDGIGDFKGLTARLDYLNDGDPSTTSDLGVTGIWLMPIHPASSYHGYDVTDFFSVNPEYGTQADFEAFMTAAHKRGIRVILDLVLNHTSDKNPWFLEAQKPGSAQHDWYVWADQAPEGAGGWYGIPKVGFYYAHFTEHMPDLNYRNPEVTARMDEAARHWLVDEHVDGFRIDAAKYLIEEGAATENTDATHTWYQNFRTYYRALSPQALTVGEVWSPTTVASTYAQGDQFDLTFDFDLAQAEVLSSGVGNAYQVTTTLSSDLRQFKPNQFASFLTNHDQTRIMSVLKGQVEKAKNAATLLLTGPGVPFIYYGEEIGMKGEKPDEDLRRPMQWSLDPNAGFSTGTPWRPLNDDWKTDNVAAQVSQPDSLLAFYRQLIAIRAQHSALRVGDTYVLDAGSRSVYAVLRTSADEAILVLVNLSASEVSDYGLALAKSPLQGGYAAASILGSGEPTAPSLDGQGGFKAYKPLAKLPAFSRYIIQLNTAP